MFKELDFYNNIISKRKGVSYGVYSFTNNYDINICSFKIYV